MKRCFVNLRASDEKKNENLTLNGQKKNERQNNDVKIFLPKQRKTKNKNEI